MNEGRALMGESRVKKFLKNLKHLESHKISILIRVGRINVDLINFLFSILLSWKLRTRGFRHTNKKTNIEP